jgi:hypothetical protein
MAGDFQERTNELLELVGDGDLEIKVEMNQVYAGYQHRGISRFTGRPLVYHRGGESHFLHNAMINGSDAHLEKLAASFPEVRRGAVEVAGDVRSAAEANAPVEFHNLARSGHETVTDDGAVIHDRPPDVPRLSDEALRAQRAGGSDVDYGSETRPRL